MKYGILYHEGMKHTKFLFTHTGKGAVEAAKVLSSFVRFVPSW